MKKPPPDDPRADGPRLLPFNIRPCANCGEEKPIVKHGLCDKCRKRADRAEARLLAASAVTEDVGTRNLAKLYELMRACKVGSSAKATILRAFLPYSGLAQNIQEAHLDALAAETKKRQQRDD
jgi:hypothetical protein